MTRGRRLAGLWVVVIGLAALLVGAPTVSAHTDFESSSPAQGDVIAEPVSTVVLVFSADTEPIDDLVVALDATGTLQNPTDVTTADSRTFTATFDPPLAGGDIGIRWAVAGADGHPLEGAFSFTVTAPLPTTTAPAATAPVETAVATTAPPETGATDDGTVADADESAVAPVLTSPPTTEVAVTVAVAEEPTSADSQTLDEFLTVESEVPGEARRLVGRLLTIPALAAGLGALAFLAFALRGSAREIGAVVKGVRVFGVVVAVGAFVHYLGVIASTGDSFASGWTETPSRAIALRLVGAIVLVAGLRTSMVMSAATKSLSAAVIDSPTIDAAQHAQDGKADERWDPNASKLAVVGVALLVASFWFDGHTVSKGWRPLHALVNSVHVVAGSIWFGGVITLAAVAWWRHRRGSNARLDELVVRFSSVATVALAAVAAAGVVLGVFVLDGFGDLTGTEWGRTLLLKSAAVALAASLGAYNHFRLRPALVAAPDDPAVRANLRSVLTAEAILLTFVVVVTCWLVVAAT